MQRSWGKDGLSWVVTLLLAAGLAACTNPGGIPEAGAGSSGSGSIPLAMSNKILK